MSDSELDLPWLGDLLNTRDEAGQPLYSAEVVEDFVAALLLSRGVGDAAERPALRAALTRFSARAGLDDAASAEALEAAIGRYFEAHPLPVGLTRAFAQRYQQDLGTLVDRGADLALAKTKAPPVEGAPRGPLAFFAAHDDFRDAD